METLKVSDPINAAGINRLTQVMHTRARVRGATVRTSNGHHLA